MLALTNVFVVSYAQSDFFGKLIILSLVGISMICWVVLLHKIWMLRQVKKLSESFLAVIEEQKNSLLSFEVSPPSLESTFNPFGQIFQSIKGKTIDLLNKNRYFISQTAPGKANVYLTLADLELLESHVSATISSQNKVLEKNLFILPTIAALAPFIGLLGTVWGILVSLSGLQNGGAMGSNASILGGLSTALSTTVLGLMIAIPALVAYNYIKAHLKNYSSDMEGFLTSLISRIELQYRKVE
ncbi:MAG: MotA/TolQ/ExbB proton channel family protein [Rhabdochlamydiaceae bacterium]|nr:MotA/TolQ/ExbB proton channel family protein [Rhabdochlamydiaceae bacterium]